MPVSHEYGCLYVHIPKTAGTSIETALQMRGERNAEHRDLLYGPILSWRLRWRRLQTQYLQHLTFAEIRKVAPEIAKKGYFSFAFVRNPWARMVSVYHSPDPNMVRLARRQGVELTGLSFGDFVARTRTLSHAHMRSQWEYVCDRDGVIRVDFLGRFERLNEDFAEVCERLGTKVTLPWRNRAPHGSESGYRDYFCARTRRITEERYRRDIELFGYRF